MIAIEQRRSALLLVSGVLVISLLLAISLGGLCEFCVAQIGYQSRLKQVSLPAISHLVFAVLYSPGSYTLLKMFLILWICLLGATAYSWKKARSSMEFLLIVLAMAFVCILGILLISSIVLGAALLSKLPIVSIWIDEEKKAVVPFVTNCFFWAMVVAFPVVLGCLWYRTRRTKVPQPDN